MEWMDWKHVRYTLKQEWAYVSRPARRKEGCTPGIRDSNNDGKTPEEFLSEVNSHIQECRAKGWGLELPVEHALLLLDEIEEHSPLLGAGIPTFECISQADCTALCKLPCGIGPASRFILRSYSGTHMPWNPQVGSGRRSQ